MVRRGIDSSKQGPHEKATPRTHFGLPRSVWKIAWAVSSVLVLVLSVRRASAERPAQRRVVTFIDGSVPRIRASGERFVHGELELEIRFINTNPLCFAYSVDGQTLPDTETRSPPPAWNDMVSAARGSQHFRTVQQAQTAVDTVLRDLGTLSTEAANDASVEQVWGACLWADPPSRVMPLQRKRIAEVDGMMRTRLAPNGAWTRILVAALDTLASVRKQVGVLPSVGRDDPESARLERQRLRSSVNGLDRYVTATLALVHRLQEDLQRAQTRLASAPASTTRHIAANRKVTVEVQRTRLDRGRPRAGLDMVTVTSETYESLPPIFFDIGVGPSLTFRNTQDYGLGQKTSAQLPNVRRTEDSMNVDVVLAMSMYVWGRRYLDDGIFDAEQLLPRPMIGLSFDQLFSSMYFGAQIDPIQFLDISVGARAYSTNHLIAPQEGQVAYTDPSGEPAQPVTRHGVTTQVFVSLTASSDLFQRWIQRSF